MDDETLDLVSTWVDPEVRGHGVGRELVVAALEHARSKDMGIIPSCWFVETVLERNPEYRDLVAG